LIAAGFQVTCGDLYPELFQLADVEIQRCDLHERFPYLDCSFDHATCIEGLEHVENVQHAIREFARVLRPGGQFVTSVPNILNIEERLKLLLYGYTSHFKPISRASLANVAAQYGDKKEVALHINSISYPELRYCLEESGFEIIKLYRDKPKRNSWLYWPMILLIRLIGRLTPAQKKRERWTKELMSDEILLGGNTLIVHAERK
jgi:SAM-dependent methyltransferase